MQYFLTTKNPRYYVVSRNYVGFVQMEVMGLEPDEGPAFSVHLKFSHS